MTSQLSLYTRALSYPYSGLDNALAHTLMVAALALVISLILFSIGLFEYPYSGNVRVGPEGFELALERMESSKLSEL